MKRWNGRKKKLSLLSALAVAAATAVAAYAYFTTTGSGTGSASVTTNTALTITQTNSITGLTPAGPSAAVTFSITNAAANGDQNLGKVTISNIAVDSTHQTAGCQASWFSAIAPASAVGTINAGTTYTSVAGTQPSVQMTESGTNQNACQGATLTLTLSGAAGT